MFGLSTEFWQWIIGQVAIMVVAYFGLKQTVALQAKRLDTLEEKVDSESKEIKGELKTLTDLLVRSARFEERQARTDEHILLIRKDIDDIKHYKGFVNGGQTVSPAVP